MRILEKCPICSQENIVVINENRLIEMRCTNNHSYRIWVQSHLSELLFDRACLFLINGYYREAVFNFYASLERFREFFVKFFLLKKNIADDQIKYFLKEISGNSENQYGAYLHAFTSENLQEIGVNEKNTIRAGRNPVIHKGHFSNEEECKKYGDNIFKLIKHDYSYLKKDPDFIKIIHQEMLFENQNIKHDIENMTIMSPGFQLVHLEEVTFEVTLSRILLETKREGSWYFNK